MNINLNLLKYFYVVASYNSYTEAANRLNISQPSLSYSIKTLENQLNIKLFCKKNNKIALTGDGTLLFEKVEQIMNIVDSIDNIDNKEEITYNITFGLRSLYAIKIFPKIANKIVDEYPNIKIDFVVGTTTELEKMLINNQVDIVIDEREYNNCYSKVLGEYQSYLITTNRVLEKINENNNMLSSVIKKGIYLVERNLNSESIIKNNSKLKFKLVQSTPMLIEKIKNDDVIGVGHELVIQDELKKGDIVTINSFINIPKSKLYIQCQNTSFNKKVKEIIDFYSVN